jgi:hypothetical protein
MEKNKENEEYLIETYYSDKRGYILIRRETNNTDEWENIRDFESVTCFRMAFFIKWEKFKLYDDTNVTHKKVMRNIFSHTNDLKICMINLFLEDKISENTYVTKLGYISEVLLEFIKAVKSHTKTIIDMIKTHKSLYDLLSIDIEILKTRLLNEYSFALIWHRRKICFNPIVICEQCEKYSDSDFLN